MSEVTRAEQLANWLDLLDLRAPEKIMQAVSAAAELRRLSAVEARQSELIQQAKEAMREATAWDVKRGYLVPYRVRDPLIATLSAINEWEKSNG